MLYTIKQYKLLFMNSVINKFEDSPKGVENIDTNEYWDLKKIPDNVAYTTGNAIFDIANKEELFLDADTMDSLKEEEKEAPTLTEDELRDLWLPDDVTSNLAYNTRNGDSVVVTNENYGSPTIEVNSVVFILNWEKTEAYNNYATFNNSDNFGQASFPN